jgi:chitinase
MIRLLRLTPALVLAAITAMPQARCAGPEPSKEKVFVGYVFHRPGKINYLLYTHLCHAFLVADENGQVASRRDVPDKDLVAQAHRAGVKVLISLGGWGWDRQFASIVSRPDAENRYVKTVLDLVDEFDYDGIDLDWEYPDTAQEVAGFERLARRLRTRLDELATRKRRPMVLTMAVSSNPGTLRWLSKDIVLETMDWLNVMTYDFAGPWTDYAGHHAPLFPSSKQPKGGKRSAASTMSYLVDERGLPADRLAVGIPLYGRGFAVSEPYAPLKEPRGQGRNREGSFARLVRLRSEGWTRRWDDETKNPWLIAPDRSSVIGYDDAESVAIKTRWALDRGFRGVFFWQIGGDLMPDGSNPLQEAARATWVKAGASGALAAGLLPSRRECSHRHLLEEHDRSLVVILEPDVSGLGPRPSGRVSLAGGISRLRL